MGGTQTLDLEFAAGITARGFLLGTWQYMSPGGDVFLHAEREGVLVVFAKREAMMLEIADPRRLFTFSAPHRGGVPDLRALVFGNQGVLRIVASTVDHLLEAIDRMLVDEARRRALGLPP